MTITSKTFEVTIDNDRAALAFGLRGAALDYIRTQIKDTLSRAEDAEIDRNTALRRFAMTYAASAKGYRLPRTIPAGIVRWAMAAEMNKGREGIPEAYAGTVGTFSKESVTTLPGNLLLIKLGGVMFVGTLEGGIPAELGEVRVHKQDVQRGGKYIATLIMGRTDDGDGADAPEPVEPEMTDA